MLNTSVSQFKQKHQNKKNQILFYTIKSDGVNETENLINNFLIEKNSFIFESVEKGKIKGRYTILGRSPDYIWEFRGNKCKQIYNNKVKILNNSPKKLIDQIKELNYISLPLNLIMIASTAIFTLKFRKK